MLPESSETLQYPDFDQYVSSHGPMSALSEMDSQETTQNLMTEAQRLKPLKHRELPPGFDEFAQALKETNTAKAWLINPALIKAMEKPGKISTPKPVDESGFQEASLDESFFGTPKRMTPKQARKAKKTSDEVKPWFSLPGLLR
jgi:hypothetical protein